MATVIVPEPSEGAGGTPAGPPASLAIETHGLRKHYGDFVAVDGLDLAVRESQVYGLLGPNGAGKTTTTRMPVGLTEPTDRTASVRGCYRTQRPLKVERHV